ncbi:hypothetical protein CsatA_015166 [Cannabis sativa]
MNPGESWELGHQIDQDLLQLLHEVHPRLRVSPPSTEGNSSDLVPSHRMMARTKKTTCLADASNPQVALLATLPDAEQDLAVPMEEDREGDAEVQEVEELDEVRPGSPPAAEGEEEVGPPNFGEYNETGQPVDVDGDVLVEGMDNVSEELAKAVPHRRQGALGARWVSPLSKISEARLRTLNQDGYLGELDCYIPAHDNRATNPDKGMCAWLGSHGQQGALMTLQKYFRDVADFFALRPAQITPKGFKYLSALFVLYASQGWDAPSPHKVAWFFDLKSTPKQGKSGYFYFSQPDFKWLSGKDHKAISKIGHFVDEYFMVKDLNITRTQFQQIPTYHRPPLTLALRDRAQKLARLPEEDRNIIQLTSDDNLVKYVLGFMP